MWKRQKAGDVNDTYYLGHVLNFGQYLYFSVLVSSTSSLLLVRYTLWPLQLKVIFENRRNSIFLMKNYSKSSDICVFTLSKKEHNWLQKNLQLVAAKRLASYISLVVERCPNPRWISCVLFFYLNKKRLLILMTWL